MVLSRTGEYALRAVLHLAMHGNGVPVRSDDIAAALAVPRNYLSKILHELSRTGVLSSTRGPKGGFRLALPPNELSLEGVVGRFEAFDDGSACLLGQPGGCSDENPCAAHERWRELSRSLQSFFRETTVAQLLERPYIADEV